MKLVIALETTENDEAVATPASNLARAAGAEVVLVNAVNPLTDAASVVAASRAEAIAQVRAERTEYLQRFAQHFEHARVRVEEVKHGDDIPTCIAQVASEEGADILVIATNRASGVRGLILGSVAQHLLRLSPCPMLVVRVD